jgi:hypothetical protein
MIQARQDDDEARKDLLFISFLLRDACDRHGRNVCLQHLEFERIFFLQYIDYYALVSVWNGYVCVCVNVDYSICQQPLR